jgi:ATP-dependent Lon protease
VTDLEDLGLFPLPVVLLPGERIPLHLFEPRYRTLFADCVLAERPFVLVLGSDEGTAGVGCAARFDTLVRRFADGRMNVLVSGAAPVEIVDATDGRPYASAQVRRLDDEAAPADAELADAALGLYRRLSEQVTGAAKDPEAPPGVPLSYAIAGAIELEAPVKQRLLEARREDERLRLVHGILAEAVEGIDRSRIAADRAQRNGRVTLT